jgi:hypothetical protein
MRSVCVLVLACLVAACGARPLAIERRDTRASRIEAAPAAVVVLARRIAPQLPELRLAPAVLVATPVITAPARVAIEDLAQSAARLVACAVDTPCARGPPMARVSSSV